MSSSRAYWEAKAEQVMDRVFQGAAGAAAAPPPPPASAADQAPIEVEVREASIRRPWPWGLQQRPWLVGVGCGLVVLASGGSLLLWRGWSQAQHELRQERTLRLLESVRALAPATTPAPAPATGANPGGSLPPPPPDEPWIEELSQLQGGEAGGSSPLRVPLSGPLNSPPPVATGGSSAVAPSSPGEGGGAALPELLGVVQIPGKPGSAIFQVGGSSTNALVGETIGSSGWRLQATSGDSAVIERGGVSRRISISSGF